MAVDQQRAQSLAEFFELAEKATAQWQKAAAIAPASGYIQLNEQAQQLLKKSKPGFWPWQKAPSAAELAQDLQSWLAQRQQWREQASDRLSSLESGKHIALEAIDKFNQAQEDIVTLTQKAQLQAATSDALVAGGGLAAANGAALQLCTMLPALTTQLGDYQAQLPALAELLEQSLEQERGSVLTMTTALQGMGTQITAAAEEAQRRERKTVQTRAISKPALTPPSSPSSGLGLAANVLQARIRQLGPGPTLEELCERSF